MSKKFLFLPLFLATALVFFIQVNRKATSDTFPAQTKEVRHNTPIEKNAESIQTSLPPFHRNDTTSQTSNELSIPTTVQYWKNTAQVLEENKKPYKDSTDIQIQKQMLLTEDFPFPVVVETIESKSSSHTNISFLRARAAHRIIISSTALSKHQLANLEDSLDWRIVRSIDFTDSLILETPSPTIDSVDQVLDWLALEAPGIHAETDIIYFASDIHPNDPKYKENLQWGLKTINAPNGWERRNDASSIKVAIIDTGVNTTHKDLKSNIWKNSAEIPDNNKDDDGNGYVDDYYGLNLFADGAPEDDSGHGTHIAGIIGAKGNNNIGVSGVCWDVQLMNIKFLSGRGAGTLSDAIKSIEYAVNNGAQIINASWGSSEYSETLRTAIAKSDEADVLFVTAAGNDSSNNDAGIGLYPANYLVPSIISVASIKEDGNLSPFSNYGPQTVRLAAPGSEIFSTWINSTNSYASISGTSMATPFVSGVLALYLAEYPNDPPRKQFSRLVSSGRPSDFLKDSTRSGTIPDLKAGLEMVDVPTPPYLYPKSNVLEYVDYGGGFTLRVLNQNDFAQTSYQWYYKDTIISGENNLDLTLPFISANDAGTYTLTASNKDGTDSIDFELRVFAPNPHYASILDIPDQTIVTHNKDSWYERTDESAQGGSALSCSIKKDSPWHELRLLVDGPGQLRFKTKGNGVRHTLRPNIKIDSQNWFYNVESQWNESIFDITEPGQHRITWYLDSNTPYNNPDIEFSLDSLAFIKFDKLPPSIERNYYRANSHKEGSTARLRFSVKYAPERFDWYKNAKLIATTNEPILTISPITFADEGTYTLRASNKNGEAVSEPIEISVENGPPYFKKQLPERTGIIEGESIILDPDPAGSEAMTFQWYNYSNTPILGATNSVLELNPTTMFDTNTYWLRATYPSSGEFRDSNKAYVYIEQKNQVPQIQRDRDFDLLKVIRLDPEAEESEEIEAPSLTLTQTVTGSTPISYQWYFNNAPVLGATQKDLTIHDIAAEKAGFYQLKATNEHGTTLGSTYQLLIEPIIDWNKALDYDLSSVWAIYQGHYNLLVESDEFIGGSAVALRPINEFEDETFKVVFTIEGPGMLNASVYADTPTAPRAYYPLQTLRIFKEGILEKEQYLNFGKNEFHLQLSPGPNRLNLLIDRQTSSRFLLDDFNVDRSLQIFAQPESKVLTSGEEIQLSLEVSQDENVSYQWYKDNTPLLGETNIQLIIPNAQSTHKGNYKVLVTQNGTTIESQEAKIDVVDNAAESLGWDDVTIETSGSKPWTVWESPDTEGKVLRGRVP